VIVELVKSGAVGDEGKPFRPSKAELSEDAGSNEYIYRCLTSLMDECWAEKELIRPSFDGCLNFIYRRTGNKSVRHSVTHLVMLSPALRRHRGLGYQWRRV